EHRNTAYFTAHITDLDMESFNLKKRTTSKVKQFSVKQDDARFAFLLHPLTIRNYADVDHSLEVLSDDQISRLAEAVADNFDPFVLGDAYITSKTGRRAYGEFIIIPRTAKEFLRLSQSDALSEIRTAAKIAKKRGAKIIGLGAYTSVLTQGGFYLKKENLPPLTTGNSYTALSGKQAVEMALKRSRKTLSSSSVAVVGASGSIGRAISILLSQEVKKLILIGNPARPKESRIRMLDIIAEILQLTKKASLRAGSLSEKLLSWLPSSTDSLTKSDWVKLADEIEQRSGLIHATCNLERWLPESDVVITCTNAADDLITGELLKMEAIVCDISRPTNLCPDLRHQRPDVSVIDGGVVRLPEGSCINFNYDLDSYHAYACMAETMILALENRYEDTSLGIDLELNKVLDFAQLAERHGFQVVLDRLNSKSKIQKV
ncbi:MAG: aminotransferase III, partial [Blastocatellia bacterium]|nr:aminotransferase III [Blastocatellia bacterium]